MFTVKKLAPIPSKVYTLKEVYKDLDLRDSPCLRVFYKDKWETIDTVFVGEELAKAPRWVHTKWAYVHTRDWTPIFEAVDSPAIVAMLDEVPDDYDPTFPPRLQPRQVALEL